ncbi:hypothetical protein B9Z55_015117 [Caenorhabditis nigoni]|uniref:Coatomer subunit epsilon n=1 Tax=Caenorhabditis nigoni TaxID=1611254 RepID=A0A2G5U8S2_9PELO|nr:hypothetical protein B9Z55_015117 [Caenorhabditis nigoni]
MEENSNHIKNNWFSLAAQLGGVSVALSSTLAVFGITVVAGVFGISGVIILGFTAIIFWNVSQFVSKKRQESEEELRKNHAIEVSALITNVLLKEKIRKSLNKKVDDKMSLSRHLFLMGLYKQCIAAIENTEHVNYNGTERLERLILYFRSCIEVGEYDLVIKMISSVTKHPELSAVRDFALYKKHKNCQETISNEYMTKLRSQSSKTEVCAVIVAKDLLEKKMFHEALNSLSSFSSLEARFLKISCLIHLKKSENAMRVAQKMIRNDQDGSLLKLGSELVIACNPAGHFDNEFEDDKKVGNFGLKIIMD